jgi:hypothetical protein
MHEQVGRFVAYAELPESKRAVAVLVAAVNKAEPWKVVYMTVLAGELKTCRKHGWRRRALVAGRVPIPDSVRSIDVSLKLEKA